MTIRYLSPDPVHDRPSKPTVDELRHDVESAYGQLVHAGRVATDRGSAEAYRVAAGLVERLLWPVTA